MSRITGSVKWFDARKGYGFIVGPAGEDVFVHFSQIKTDGFRLLKDNEEVEYELVDSDKGKQAYEVIRLNPVDDKDDQDPGQGGGGGGSSYSSGGYRGRG